MKNYGKVKNSKLWGGKKERKEGGGGKEEVG